MKTRLSRGAMRACLSHYSGIATHPISGGAIAACEMGEHGDMVGPKRTVRPKRQEQTVNAAGDTVNEWVVETSDDDLLMTSRDVAAVYAIAFPGQKSGTQSDKKESNAGNELLTLTSLADAAERIQKDVAGRTLSDKELSDVCRISDIMEAILRHDNAKQPARKTG